MSEVKSTFDYEIDLYEYFETLWDGKWKIVAVVAFSVLSVFGYQIIQPQSGFEAETEIKPINSIDAERYRQSNALGFFEVTPNKLLDLYIELLDERTLFEEAIRKYKLIDIEKFEDKEAFEEAVIALASSIEILPPINVDGTDRGEVKLFWTIRFEYNDDANWKSVLSFVDSNANQSVKSILQQRFQTTLSVAKQKQVFELEDIETQMANAKRDFDKEMSEFELKQGFQLEDVQTQIDNALADYERKTSDRLAFLREQASIARKLGVAKNTIEAQMFSAQNGVVANVKTDTPFYLRGYEAIEKEVELIESREDTKAFIGGLLELEQKKRGLEQDRTLQRVEKNKAYLESIIELEKKQRLIEQNKTLARAESLLNTTPLMSGDEFSATSITIGATEFESQSNRLLMMITMAIVIGGIVGAIYVLISNDYRNRKEQFTKT